MGDSWAACIRNIATVVHHLILFTVGTSVVPLSLMPYLSLVFLILSDMLWMNFLISCGQENNGGQCVISGEPCEKTPIIAIPRGADIPLMHLLEVPGRINYIGSRQTHTCTNAHAHTPLWRDHRLQCNL